MTNNLKKSFPRTPLWYLVSGLLFATLLGSCSVKNIIYFNDLPADSLKVMKAAADFTEPVIQADDILSITVQTLDPSTSSIVNQAEVVQAVGASSATSVGNQVITGFLVDKDGYVHMTLLGKVKVLGLTTYQARELITKKASQFYHNPTAQVRFANYKFTVLGEVVRPATYTVPNEKVTVLDALGLAGDLTIYGRRENVLLVREENGQKAMIRLNLNDSDIFQSPYYYLRQNDVIYVEPGKAKAAANNASNMQIFGVITSVLSLVLIALRVR